MDVVECFAWIVRKLDRILHLLEKQGKKVMALPKLVADTIEQERQAAIERDTLLTQSKESEAKALEQVAKLETMLQAETVDKTAVQAELNAMKASHIDQAELLTAIQGIENTPLAAAVVTEVIANPLIETPSQVVDAPPMEPQLIQEPEVTTAAIEALNNASEGVVPTVGEKI